MKKIINIVYMTLILSVSLFASTRGDVKVIEASENIRFFGQKIAKDYLYLYQNPKRLELKERLTEDINSIEKFIIDIATITNSKDSQNILDFLAYNKDEIKELLQKKVSREHGILMIDYGESFLEGANSIEKTHKYKFSLEEEMLMSLKDVKYLLERTSKYYIAFVLDIDKNSNFSNMEQAITNIESILQDVNSYKYPTELLVDIENVNSIWKRHKEFLYKSKKLPVPNLLLSSTTTLENSVDKIAKYHKQNQ